MAKLFVRLTFFLLCIHFAKGQETLCVYKTGGTSLLEDKNMTITLKKGALIQKKNLIKVLPKASFTAIDNNGNAYNVNVDGRYNFENLLNFKTKENKSNFTANYFKYIWQELTNSGEKKNLIAGVFRGDFLMLSPSDSSKIASSKITLKWQTIEDTKLYYVFLRNVDTDDILKIETNGTQLALYDEASIFYDGSQFEWAVSTDAFPNLDNIPFFSFELIDRNQYEAEKTTYKDFISDLKNMNISEKEIEAILCRTYGLCK